MPTLARLFEHNAWATQAVIAACADLDDAALDAAPLPTTDWSIRRALVHLAEAERAYVALLALPPDERDAPPLAMGDLADATRASGAALLELVTRDGGPPTDRARSRDGYDIDPWLVLLQAINHAHDHRRQVGDMLRAQGLPAPDVTGWAFGEVHGGLEQVQV